MTRTTKSLPPHRWLLQDAKTHSSKLIHSVRTDGPQHVTVHGSEEVVVVSAEDYRRLTQSQTGEALIAAMQASPYRDIDLEPKRSRPPVRGVDL